MEKETGFTLNYDKYNWEEHPEHFILQDITKPVDFGEGKKNMYAYADTEILVQRDREVQMAVNEFGKGRSVYISGLPYSFENSRILYRSILWSAHGEDILHCWYSENFNVEVHAYVEKMCIRDSVYAMKQAEALYQKEHPNFKLDIQEKVYTDIEQSLITAAEAGNYDTLPDIFLMQDYSFHKDVANYPEIFTELTDSGIDFSQFSGGKLSLIHI